MMQHIASAVRVPLVMIELPGCSALTLTADFIHIEMQLLSCSVEMPRQGGTRKNTGMLLNAGHAKNSNTGRECNNK